MKLVSSFRMKPVNHIKIGGRGIGYSLLLAIATSITAVVGSFIARFIFSPVCYPAGMGCKGGLLPNSAHFAVKQLVAVIVFLIPVVVLAPFALFAKLIGLLLNESVSAFPAATNIPYPTSFHLAFWVTILYYVSIGISVSYYRALPTKRPVIQRVLRVIAVFHIAIALTVTLLTVQLYPY